MYKQLKQMIVCLNRKRVLLFVLIFSITFLGSAIYRLAKQNKWLEEEFTKQVKSNDLNNELAKLSFYIKNAESAERGYTISGNPKFVLNFSATIDSIRATYLQIKQFENRENEIVNATMYLRTDSLIEQKITFMQLVKSLCDNDDRKAAAALIATNKGQHLSDSITLINKQISENILEQLKKSQTGFLKINSKNNRLTYTGIVASIMLIMLVFYFLIIEIRRKKRVSDELRVRKEHFKVTLNSIGEGLITTDKMGYVVYMNPAAEQLTGWSWQEAKKQLLQNVYDVVNEETGRPFENIVSRIIKQGKMIELENNTILKAKNTGRFIISNTAAPLLDSNGNISGAVLVFNNITEKKEIERQLKNSEEKYRNLIEEASDAILIYSFDGTIHEFNRSCYTMLGYSKEEYAILKLTDILVDDIIVDQENYAAILAGETKTLIRKLMKKDGTLLETEVTVKMLADGRAISFARDITERVKSQGIIKKEKELSDSVINSLPGIFYLFDETGKFLRWNSEFEITSGYSAEEIAKMHPVHFFGGDEIQLISERIAEVFSKGSSTVEAYFITKDNRKIPFYFTGTLTSYDNKPCVIGVGIDITERKNAETKTKTAIERYDILADATSDTIWDWDIVNNKMLYNEGITKMFGYNTSEVGNVVDWWNDKLHSDDFQTVQDSLEDIFEKKNERLQLQYRFRCADGSYKHIFDRAFVIFDNNGKPTRMIGAMQDITYQSDEELRIAKATLDAQEAERNNLGAELHDNINQILAGTLLTLSMAKSTEVFPGQQKEFVETAMGYITDAISETRKLSHNLAPASFEDNSLKELFENLLLSINLENQFTISFDFDEFKETVIPENIQVNLYRILQEQTKNILKYAEASTIEIAVKIIDNAVMLRIYDNGKGFVTKAKKTGIGLSNIKKRAESLLGKFKLNSAPGKGCEIRVEIPL